LSPKLVGESVGLHPVWRFSRCWRLAGLFGFTGLITRFLCRRRRSDLAFCRWRYRESNLYTGTAGPDPQILFESTHDGRDDEGPLNGWRKTPTGAARTLN